MSTSTLPAPLAMGSPDGLPPGPRGMPLLGSTPAFSRDQLRFVTRMQREYGDYVTVRMVGGFPVLMLFAPSAIRHVLTEQPRNFTSREFNYVLKSFLGDGLLTIDGDFHRQQRRLVQPAFHKKRVEGYATIMTSHTADLLATWRRGERIDIAAAMQQLTLRIVAKALFDVDLNAHSQALGNAFNAVIRFPQGRILSWKRWLRIDSPLTPYGQYMRGQQVLNQTVYDIIATRRAKPQDTGDILSMLLAARDEDESEGPVPVGLTDQQIRDEVMTFFAAGHETTANTLTWTFHLLGTHPAAAQRLRAELVSVLGGRTPTLEDLPNLTYTDMVIKESMRLFPPAWAIGRRAVEACDIDGYHVPAGQVVMMSQWVTHRMPSIWGPDAAEFLPERFDPEHPYPVPPFAYFPFGGGPRMCIGMPFAQMEARLLLATIAQQFLPQPVPGFPVVPEPHITVRPKYGLRMTLA